MHPVLFTLPLFGTQLDIPTYGILLALAFLIVLKVAAHLARQERLDPRDVLDLCFVVFLAGLVGAKLLLILLDLPYYLSNPRALASTIRSAGVFYGGLLTAIPVGIWYVRRRALPLWKVADILGICLPIGSAFGRMGCLAAGCCYGKPSHLPWAIIFTSEKAQQTTGIPLNVPLHPTQIYLSLNALFLTAILFWIRRRKRYDGQVFLWFIVLYGGTRSFWEIFRGDAVRGFLVPDLISTSQAIGMVSVLAGLGIMMWRRHAARPS
ncbi:MAG: prolipoprotein diacylglyceryl transferase [Acidobacteriota bacterium]